MDSNSSNLTVENQPAIGKPLSSTPLTVEQELAKLNQYLDDFEIECGLPSHINENTVNKATELMNIDFSSFKPTTDECQEYALILSTYLNNLQRLVNKEKGIIHWAKERIKKAVVQNLKQQSAYNWEERMAGAIAENEVAIKLQRIKIQAELKLSRIESLYFSAKNIRDSLVELGKSIRGLR